MTSKALLAGWLLMPLLAACVAPSREPVAYPSRPATSAPSKVPSMTPAPPTAGFIAPQVMRGPGLDGVIGRNETALANLFGAPALSVVEGDARKLQFRGAQCVLDIFLYPLSLRAEPSATWIEARRPQDGRDVDRAACISALRR